MKSLTDILKPLQKLNIIRDILVDDGNFPNNSLLPLMLYKNAFALSGDGSTDEIKELLETNNWTNFWENGIYDYHHYHSNTHEVLVALAGSARVQFGGPNGVTIIFEEGDVVMIPAGVAHKRVDELDGFKCLGAYPDGRDYDLKKGEESERPDADNNIRAVPVPGNDPLYGSDGPLVKNWAPNPGDSEKHL